VADREVGGVHDCVEHDHEGATPCPRCAAAAARVACAVRPPGPFADAHAEMELRGLAAKAMRERDALRAALRALVDALPKCDRCREPATHRWRHVHHDVPLCGAHGREQDEQAGAAGYLRRVEALPTHEALAAAREALGEGGA
jgi:hypothetical protein